MKHINVSQLSNLLDRQLYNEFNCEFSSQIWSQLRGQLESQLNDQCYDQFISNIKSQLYDRINGKSDTDPRWRIWFQTSLESFLTEYIKQGGQLEHDLLNSNSVYNK